MLKAKALRLLYRDVRLLFSAASLISPNFSHVLLRRSSDKIVRLKERGNK